MGFGLDVPRLGQARRRKRRTHSPGAQKNWAVNQPVQLAKVLQTLEAIQKDFNGSAIGGKKVFAGRPDRSRGLCSHRESREGGRAQRESPVHAGTHGRLTRADGMSNPSNRLSEGGRFRNYFSGGPRFSPEELLVDRAQLLKLTARR